MSSRFERSSFVFGQRGREGVGRIVSPRDRTRLGEMVAEHRWERSIRGLSNLSEGRSEGGRIEGEGVCVVRGNVWVCIERRMGKGWKGTWFQKLLLFPFFKIVESQKKKKKNTVLLCYFGSFNFLRSKFFLSFVVYIFDKQTFRWTINATI